MSSRNVRLTPLQRDAAPFIYKILKETKIRFKTHTVSETKDWVAQQFQTHPLLDLEYFEITDEETLISAASKNTNQKQRAFIAVFADAIRLIDNMPL
jgi:pantoate--beta-alanine ligase